MFHTFPDITVPAGTEINLYDFVTKDPLYAVLIQNKSTSSAVYIRSTASGTAPTGIQIVSSNSIIINTDENDVFIRNSAYSVVILSVTQIPRELDVTELNQLQEHVDDNTARIVVLEGDISTLQTTKVNISSIVDNLTSTSTVAPLSANQGKVLNDNATALTTRVTTLEDAQEVRQKNEVRFSGISVAVTSTPVNLINAIKTYTPTSGTLDQFINTISDKVNFYSYDSSTFFKLNFNGTWSNQSSNMSFTFELSNSTFSKLTSLRTPGIADDTLSFSTFVSIDEGDTLVTTGTPMMLSTNGGTFTITSMLLIIEQNVPEIIPITVV